MTACSVQGFYAVYAGVFAGVAQMELDAGTGHEDWPEFGTSLHHAAACPTAHESPAVPKQCHGSALAWVQGAM